MVQIKEVHGHFEVTSRSTSLRFRDKAKALMAGNMLAIMEEARTGREARIVLSAAVNIESTTNPHMVSNAC